MCNTCGALPLIFIELKEKKKEKKKKKRKGKKNFISVDEKKKKMF